MSNLGPFQTKDDHLSAFARVSKALRKTVEDYGDGEIGFARFQRELRNALHDLAALSDLTLSDPNYIEPKPF